MEQNFPEESPISTPIAPTPETESVRPVKSSGFLVVLLSILLIISVLIAGFFAYQTQNLVKEITKLQSTPTPLTSIEPSPTADPTANWKTYKNTALGFELKYPPTVKIDKEMNDQYNRVTTFKGAGNLYFDVMLRKADDTPLDKYYFMDNPDFTKSVLDGKTANVYIYDASKNSCVSDGSGPGCPLSYVTYVAQNGSDLYHLSFFEDIQLSDIEKQILSTFKFVEPTVSSLPTTSPQL